MHPGSTFRTSQLWSTAVDPFLPVYFSFKCWLIGYCSFNCDFRYHRHCQCYNYNPSSLRIDFYQFIII